MLENLFGSRARTNLLKLFLLNQEEFFVREIARETGEKLNSVRRELQNLEKLGLIQVVEKKVELNEAGTKKKIEKRKFYKVNQNFVLYDDLRSLFLKSKLLIERTLAQKLTELGKVKLLVLSGFFVDDKDALTDILIVGQVNKTKLKTLINKISNQVDNEVRYTCMTTQEFNYRNGITDKFLFEVLEGKKIVVVDNMDK
jgi:predicted transcriptional regulator